jgi:hypothetical protein
MDLCAGQELMNRGENGPFGIDQVALCQRIYGKSFLGRWIEDYQCDSRIRSWRYHPPSRQGSRSFLINAEIGSDISEEIENG